jgi:GTP-binding nuclear protein Ran
MNATTGNNAKNSTNARSNAKNGNANARGYKCVLVGDGGCGKTAYVKKLLTGEFERKYVATLGVEALPIRAPTLPLFNMWDTAGQEKFGGLRDGYYLQADCGLVCFEPGSRLTWKNVPMWLRDLRRMAPGIPIVLVAFKRDIAGAKVTEQEIREYAEREGLPWVSISNKTSTRAELLAPLTLLAERLG